MKTKVFFTSVAVLGFIFLCAADLFFGQFCIYDLARNLLFSDLCLLIWPLSHEEESTYQLWSLPVLLLSCLVLSALRLKELMLLMIISYCLVDSLLRSKRKFSKVRILFRSAEVWNNVEDYSQLVYVLIFFCLSILTLLISFIEGLPKTVYSSLIAALLVILGYVTYLKRTTDNSFFLGKRKAKLIRSIANSNLRDPQDVDDSFENRRMHILYKRAVENMETKRPYLDENFSLEDFSRALFTNKVYLSRTINAISGRNFRQFTNCYRVRYSIELIKKDPHLKVEQIAMMSGFHTVVSYNMAFKLFMNETPSEWMHRYKMHL